MYSRGELIVYGGTGVCVVQEIAIREVSGAEKEYYILKPLYQRCTITVPVDSTKVFMRGIISKDEADEIIDSLPDIEVEVFHDRGVRQLTEHYEERIKSHSCRELAALVMSIYEKRRATLAMNKKLGAVDERYMRRTEDLLFGELAAALNIERESVLAYIKNRIGTVIGALD